MKSRMVQFLIVMMCLVSLASYVPGSPNKPPMSNYELLKSKLEEANKQVESLNSELKKAKADLEKAQSELITVSEERDKYKSRWKKYRRDFEKASSEIEELKAEILSLQQPSNGSIDNSAEIESSSSSAELIEEAPKASQPEVTGSMDFSTENGNYTFNRYEISRDSYTREPVLVLFYTFSNTSDTPKAASSFDFLIEATQNKKLIVSKFHGYDYPDLTKNYRVDINKGESIDFCCGFGLKNDYEPVEFRFKNRIQEFPDGIIDLSQINQPTPYDLDLAAGQYTGGLGIPTGTYSINLISGRGNVISDKGDVNEIFRDDRTTYYNNFNFSSGVDLKISGTLIVHIHCDAADFGAIKQREISSEAETVLYPGTYTAGYDFPVGTYFICGYDGSGNVYSHEADVNEIIAVEPKENHSISQFNYAKFKDGDSLEISGCTVKLVPAGS